MAIVTNASKYQQYDLSPAVTTEHRLQEQAGKYEVIRPATLQADELVEQCLALTAAMIETNHVGIRESLLYILEEKLLALHQLLE